MMVFDNLNDDNFMMYCMKFYDNPQCHDTKEFFDDIKRVKYVKKALSRYETTGELKDRLILNHLIILGNVFGPVVLPRILFFRMPKHLKYVKPFLVMLGYMPEKVVNIGSDKIDYDTDLIEMDWKIVEALRKITK